MKEELDSQLTLQISRGSPDDEVVIHLLVDSAVCVRHELQGDGVTTVQEVAGGRTPTTDEIHQCEAQRRARALLVVEIRTVPRMRA